MLVFYKFTFELREKNLPPTLFTCNIFNTEQYAFTLSVKLQGSIVLKLDESSKCIDQKYTTSKFIQSCLDYKYQSIQPESKV